MNYEILNESGQPIKTVPSLSVARGVVKMGVMFGATYYVLDQYGNDVTADVLKAVNSQISFK